MRYGLINQTNLLGPLWPLIKTGIKLSFHKGRPYSLTRARIYIISAKRRRYGRAIGQSFVYVRYFSSEGDDFGVRESSRVRARGAVLLAPHFQSPDRFAGEIAENFIYILEMPLEGGGKKNNKKNSNSLPYQLLLFAQCNQLRPRRSFRWPCNLES